MTIQCTVDPNERPSVGDTQHRITKFVKAIANDPRFELPEFKDQEVDLTFFNESGIYNCELKEPADYVGSVLSGNGHLYEQCLTMREAGHPCMILVLGNDDDVSKSVYNALKTRYRGKTLGQNIGSYEDRLIDFEANCEGLGISIRRWKSRPFKRLLATVHKRLTESSLLGYSPRPADGERQIAALKMCKSIGEINARKLLDEYKSLSRIGFLNKGTIQDCIGVKKGESVYKFFHPEVQ